MVQYRRPSCSSWAESVRSSFGRTIMGKAIWWNPIAARLGKGFQLGMLIRAQSKKVILICVCGLERNKTLIWCGNYTTKKSIWDSRHLSLIMNTWDALKDNVRCSNREFQRVKKLPFPQNLRISSWSYDMEGHAKKCVERYCELSNRTTQQLYKVSTPCIDDHHFKEEEMKSVGELSQVCSQIVLKCFYLARIGRPDILWSVMNLRDRLRNGPKPLTNAWIDWYLTFIKHVITNSITMWETLQNNADWDCFKTPILREILTTQKLLLEEHCAFLEVIHLFQLVGCV